MAMPQNQLQVVEQQQRQPSQPYIAQVAVTPEQALQAYRALKEITAKVLQKGTDYDVIPGTPKPSLLKPGAENLLRFHGLGHRVQKTNAIEDWEKGFFHYEFKVTVHKTFDDGREFVLSECYGSANTKEKRYRNQDPYMLVNTVQKMAIKRALVGAALQATGASGLFTQDIEDMDIVDSQDARPSGQSRNQSNGNGRKASQKQANFIMKLAQDKGVDDGLLAKMLEKGFGVQYASDLSSTDASKVIKLLQERTLEQIKDFAGVVDVEEEQEEQKEDISSLFDGVEEFSDEEAPF